MEIIRKNIGKKKLFPFLGRFSPEINDYETFYQKNLGGTFSGPAEFDPKYYVGKTLQEKRENAYQHANLHKKFYEDLIKEGVYPKGTKVKTKRMKNSNSYVIEFWMPKLNPLNDFKFASKKQQQKWDKQWKEQIHTISAIATKYGNTNSLYEDPFHSRNYGLDKEGNVKYMDTEILMKNLPLKNREKIKQTSLESKLTVFALLTIGGIALLSNSLNQTGFTISNFTQTTPTLSGLLFFIAGLVGLFLTLKK